MAGLEGRPPPLEMLNLRTATRLRCLTGTPVQQSNPVFLRWVLRWAT